MKPLYFLYRNFSLAIFVLVLVKTPAGAQTGPPDQQFIPITDSAPALVNGLQAGYIITGESEKEVGKKGNFSRYKLRFYITNTSNETRVLRDRDWGRPNQPGSLLVRFTCLNATGARLTSTECSLSATAFTADEWVDGKDAHGNNILVKRQVNVGYGIRPGESISTNTIMIVPLDQRPKVTAIFSPAATHYRAYIAEGMPPAGPPPGQPGYAPPPPAYGANPNGAGMSPAGVSVVWLKNTFTGTYLNSPNGQLICNGVNHNAWGCEWELIPVQGTNYYLIRNRFRNKYLSTENAGLLADNTQTQAALWSLEQGFNSPAFTIRNAASNAPLLFQNGVAFVQNDNNSQGNPACWFIERQ